MRAAAAAAAGGGGGGAIRIRRVVARNVRRAARNRERKYAENYSE